MALLKNGQLVKDLWRRLEDGEDPLIVEYPLISLTTWKANKISLGDLNRPLGTHVSSHTSPFRKRHRGDPPKN